MRSASAPKRSALQSREANSYNGAMSPHLILAPAAHYKKLLGAVSHALLACSLLAVSPVHPAQDDLRLEVARQWAEKGDYERAVQELRLFLNEHPDAAEVYARIGTLRLRQGK